MQRVVEFISCVARVDTSSHEPVADDPALQPPTPTFGTIIKKIGKYSRSRGFLSWRLQPVQIDSISN